MREAACLRRVAGARPPRCANRSTTLETALTHETSSQKARRYDTARARNIRYVSVVLPAAPCHLSVEAPNTFNSGCGTRTSGRLSVGETQNEAPPLINVYYFQRARRVSSLRSGPRATRGLPIRLRHWPRSTFVCAKIHGPFRCGGASPKSQLRAWRLSGLLGMNDSLRKSGARFPGWARGEGPERGGEGAEGGWL